MEDNIIHKLLDKMKNKMQKRKQGYPSVSEYAFSPEEIETLNKQNKQKIQDLKQDFLPKQKTEKVIQAVPITEEKEEPTEVIPETIPMESEEVQEPLIEEKQMEEKIQEPSQEVLEVQEEVIPQNSFIHLNKEHQELIMKKWNSIDNNEIDKDIMEGKDLLNHNYTITYADSSAKYIHDIRKKYEIVLCYLIGFNNEKKGIYDKTFFSDTIENEWKFLSNYIKVLEKIRNFKKQ